MPADRTTIVAKLRDLDPKTIHRVVSDTGAQHAGRKIEALRIVRLSVPKGSDADAVLAAVEAHPDVELATFEVQATHHSVYHYPAGNDRDDLYPEYHLRRLNVFRAWQILGNRGARTVKIACVDSGIMGAHEDWDFNDVIGYNTTTNQADPTDTTSWYQFIGDGMSHGTYIHGYMHSQPNNGVGVRGVAPGCKPVVIATGDGEVVGPWASYDLMEGIIKATDLGARIINCSWGWIASTDTAGAQMAQDAINYAWDRGTVCFAAAGNTSINFDTFEDNVPNDLDHVFNVGGSGSDDGRAIFVAPNGSNYGSIVHVCAPATGHPVHHLWGTNYPKPGTSYFYRDGNGTSFACPLAVAAGGLALSANPNLTAQQICDVIRSTADRSQAPGWETYFPNAGILNAAKAVLKAKTLDPANAGAVYPYVNAFKAGAYLSDHDGPFALTSISSGTATTTLQGSIEIEIRGYSSDPITGVELWVGGVKKYDGPARRLFANADSSGTPAEFKVVARTASASAEETYSDFVVSSLSIASDVPYFTMAVTPLGAGAFRLSGSRDLHQPVVVQPTSGTVGPVSYATASSWGATVTGASGTVTATDGTDTLTAALPASTSASDSSSSNDSNTCQVKSPASASVSDSASASDSNACLVSIATSIAGPFLLAAAFVLAVLYDTALADTGAASDTVSIAQAVRNADAATGADSSLIALTCAQADASSQADSASVAIGRYSAVTDSASPSDSNAVTVQYVSTTADAASQADAAAVEQTFPAAVDVTDSASTSDSTATVAAIGQTDGAAATDSAYAYVGALAVASDFAATSETTAATVTAAPPPNVIPIAAVAYAVRVGMLAEAEGIGCEAARSFVGQVCERSTQ